MFSSQARFSGGFGAPRTLSDARMRGFGASADSSTVGETADSLAAAETQLFALRESLVRLGVAMLRAGQGPLPQDAVDGFNTQRRTQAQNLTRFVTNMVETVRAIPWTGESMANELNAKLGGDWGLQLLNDVPLLPREIVASPSSSSPSLTPTEAAFSALPAGVALAAVYVAGIAVAGYAIYEIAGQFNAQARASASEAVRLKAWADGRIGTVQALKAAGLSADQIKNELDTNQPPPPPPPGDSLVTAAKWGIGGLVALGALYLALQIIPKRRGS